jgi:hypothetical protein
MIAMRRGLLLLAIVPVFGQPQSERIGTIDFYGYGHLDLASLRVASPLKEGDPVPSDAVRDSALQSLSRIAGRKAVLSRVCCLEDGRLSIFIGLPEVGAPALTFNPAPQGDAKLPADALRIFQKLHAGLMAVIKKGAAGEDDSQGYALSVDPVRRADQLKLRNWTRGHLAVVFKVLSESRDSDHRADAAEALGYADRSPQQIAALVTAAFDPDDGVRNNAVRALEVLCNIGAEVTSKIPAARFLPLLHSIEWKDRNKGAALLMAMTASRDPALLKMLHDQALEPLREMAQWKDFGHAWSSVMILGRIGGIEEGRLNQFNPAMVPEILRASQ